MKLKSTIVLFFLFSISIFAQNTHYSVITFEQSVEGNKKISYWIVESDSIKKHSDIKLYPLYLNLEYSSDAYLICCANEDLNFISEEKSVNSYFSDEHLSMQPDFMKSVKNNRRFLQKISHKYGSGLKTKLKVFVTPLIAEFCVCNAINNQPSSFIVLRVKSFMPKTPFKLDLNFWESDAGKRIQYYDFSKYLFESFH